MTVIFSGLWLVSSIAWAKTLSGVKTATDVGLIQMLMSACRDEENLCETLQEPTWTSLNVSVVSDYILQYEFSKHGFEATTADIDFIYYCPS